MRLVAVAVGLGLYLAGVVVLSDLIPGIAPREAAGIVGSAVLAASGGFAVTKLIRRRRAHPTGADDLSRESEYPRS
jgi:hypothetical protein